MGRRICIVVICMLFIISTCAPIKESTRVNPPSLTEGELSNIILPDGFKIDYYAQDVNNARSMTLSEKGILYVGSRKAGNVYAIIDKNNDYKADQIITILSGLNNPNGVSIKDGDLYIAEIHQVTKIENIDQVYDKSPKQILVTDDLPDDQWHGWKYIDFGPDEKLYVPQGVPCNVCERESPYGELLTFNKDGTGKDVFLKGMRNTVGFDWHPETNELWWTDNGRDWWGDDVPPDELNYAPTKGMDFGFPYCHGDGMIDDEFNTENDCSKYTGTAIDLGPHVAALGMKFYRGDQFPQEYKHQIFIAERGSWNRKDPIGYRVSLVKLKGNQAVSYEPFAYGWLKEDGVFGRPVAVLELPDGSLLVSDDTANAIYRISYVN